MSEKVDFDIPVLNRAVIAEFRANAGQPAARPWIPGPVLLLTSIGAKSGKPHVSPLLYLTDDDRLVVFGCNHSAPNHPDWYHNLVAHPEVTVEVGTESWAATAQVTVGQERDRLWASFVENYPILVEFQAKVARQFPLVIFQRRR